MDRINTRQPKTIEHAKESLRDHVENEDTQVIDPDRLRNMVIAIFESQARFSTTQTIDDRDELGNRHQLPPYLYKVARQEVRLELIHEHRRPEVARISHVVASKHQKRRFIPFSEKFTRLAFKQEPMVPEDESILIEGHNQRIIAFAPLDAKEEPWGRFSLADELLKLPDHPTYLPFELPS